VLRLFQGLFSGVIAASSTLVASIVPEDRRGAALGSLQMSWFLGTTTGPLLGGLLGDALGFRASFWIAGLVLILATLTVLLLVHEEVAPKEQGANTRGGYSQAVLALRTAGSALVIVLAARTIYRVGAAIFSPALALLVQSLLPDSTRVALITGLVASAGALGGALGSPIIGGWGDRFGHRRVLILAGLAAGASLAPQALTPNTAFLAIFQLLSGFAIGGVLSASIALMASHAPEDRLGTIFGLDASAVALANALGPLLGAGALAWLGVRSPLALAGGLMFAGWLVVIFFVPADERAGVTSRLRRWPLAWRRGGMPRPRHRR
jgi:DHA1 family multidrug resistance protein-like MFS transporter